MCHFCFPNATFLSLSQYVYLYIEFMQNKIEVVKSKMELAVGKERTIGWKNSCVLFNKPPIEALGFGALIILPSKEQALFMSSADRCSEGNWLCRC